MMTHAFKPALGRQGWLGLYEFRASQIYVMSSKPTLSQINKYKIKNKKLRASKMAQLVNALVYKADDLSSGLGTPRERENHVILSRIPLHLSLS